MDIPTTTIFIFVIDLLLHGDFCFRPNKIEQNWALVEIIILTRVTDLLILTTCTYHGGR